MKSQTKEFIILSLNREDLSFAGYDDSKVDDRTMKQLADAIGTDCDIPPFLECIERAAADLNLPKLGTTIQYEHDRNLLLNAHLDEIARAKATICATWFVGPLGFASDTNEGTLISDIKWSTKEVSHEWH